MSNFREGVHLFEADPIVQTTIFQLNIPHSIYFGFGHSGYMVADFMVEASSFPPDTIYHPPRFRIMFLCCQSLHVVINIYERNIRGTSHMFAKLEKITRNFHENFSKKVSFLPKFVKISNC